MTQACQGFQNEQAAGVDEGIYRLLAGCARAQCRAEHYTWLAQAATKITNWEEVPAQAEAQGMAPLLYTHLRVAGVHIPADTKRVLQGLTLRHRHANQVRQDVLRDILAHYQEAGIAARVLKGAALAQLIYPEPGLRPMSDLDILVPESMCLQAQSLLGALGFDVPAQPAATPHRHLAVATKEVAGVTVQVEIHTRLFSDYFDYALSHLRAVAATRPALAPLRRLVARVMQTRRPPDVMQVRTLPFTVGNIEAHTLGYEAMLGHICQHQASHFNIWDCGRLIWVADIVSFAERFVSEIDWERVQQHYPGVLESLSLFHFMTPLDDTLLDAAKIKLGHAPAELGVAYHGWPTEHAHGKTWVAVIRDTLFPSEWWLRIRYTLGSAQPLFWYRWVRHPLYILGHIARVLLENLGWPTTAELAKLGG